MGAASGHGRVLSLVIIMKCERPGEASPASATAEASSGRNDRSFRAAEADKREPAQFHDRRRYDADADEQISSQAWAIR